MDPLSLALAQVQDGARLDAATMASTMEPLMAPGCPPERASAFLMALRDRGETPDELAGAVRAVRAAMLAVDVPEPDELVDTCGTGGGAVTTFNISTAAAFVAAAAGARVAKHGNRSHTSRSGSSDVLEALGVAPADPESAADTLERHRLVFLFAPAHHPAMRHLAPVRRALGVPTVLNLVGPLANPARVRRQVVGVGEPQRGPVVAEALATLGALHALVVHAEAGLDELSPVGRSQVWEVRGEEVRQFWFEPAEAGLATASLDGLEGGSPAENAGRIEQVLEGTAPPAARAAVLLNAAAALYVAPGGGAWGPAVRAATAALDGGVARRLLEGMRAGASARTSG